MQFLRTCQDAGIPAPDIMRAMPTNGYQFAETETLGPINRGLGGEFIAVDGNPLENIDALRTVRFVMKDGSSSRRTA